MAAGHVSENGLLDIAACLHTYMYFIVKVSEDLAKKLIGDTKEKFLSTNTINNTYVNIYKIQKLR